MIYSRIAGTGSFLPEKVVTNHDLEKSIDTSDEWIRERTGIKRRHIAGDGETTSSIGLEAARRAMQAADVNAEDIDLIIVATTTPDKIFPATACIIQRQLGVSPGPAFDLQAVCSGFVYALDVANRFIQTGGAKTALVIGSETLSRIVNWKDRGTAVLFGTASRYGNPDIESYDGSSLPSTESNSSRTCKATAGCWASRNSVQERAVAVVS